MYAPSKNLREIILNAFPSPLFPWDHYEATMGRTDILDGQFDKPAAKSFFIRNAPFDGSYALLGGITAALCHINNLRFTHDDFARGMMDMGYEKTDVEFLKSLTRLRLRVYAPPEGSVFFPNEPVVSVTGPLIDMRLVEGVLLEALNFPSLSLTKWFRLVRTVRPAPVFDFSRRRAQNPKMSALCSMLAGCAGTSNADFKSFADVPIIGTMGHEWMQSYGDVRRAFDAWIAHNPDKPMGLVDTLDCLKHDFPAWLDAVWSHREEIKNANPSLWGWRNDSDDLAELTIEQYRRFFRHPISDDGWFVEHMRIALTNELDEWSAARIIARIRIDACGTGLDAEDIIRRIVWAAGTKPGACDDQPSLGGVMKLVEVGGRPCIKQARDTKGSTGAKASIPGMNLSAIVRDQHNEFVCLLIYPIRRYALHASGQLFDKYHKRSVSPLCCHRLDGGTLTIEDYTAQPRQSLVYDSICRASDPYFTEFWSNPCVRDVSTHAMREADSLPWQMTRLEHPVAAAVCLTEDLHSLRRSMLDGGMLVSEYNTF